MSGQRSRGVGGRRSGVGSGVGDSVDQGRMMKKHESIKKGPEKVRVFVRNVDLCQLADAAEADTVSIACLD